MSTYAFDRGFCADRRSRRGVLGRHEPITQQGAGVGPSSTGRDRRRAEDPGRGRHQRAERPCRCAQARAKIDSRCDWRIPIDSRCDGRAVMLKWQLWWTYIAGSIVVGFVFAALVDCGSFGMPTTPPNVPVDVGDAIACAIADAVAQRSVDDCVQKYGQKLVDDA